MSGSRQWLRKLSLIAADPSGKGIELSALRVTFTVTATTVDMPATLDARIYNLSGQTASRLLDQNAFPTLPSGRGVAPQADPSVSKVVLQAGYEGNFGTIFKGDLIQVRRGRESQTETYVDLLAGDGDWAHNWGRINTTLAAGYKPGDVNDKIRAAVATYGQSVDDLPDGIPSPQAPRGKVMYGMAREYRRDLARTYDLTSYPRQGALEWLPQSAYRPGDVIYVNSRSGMINMAQQTTFGVEVRMLLNPSVGQGSLLRIDNHSIQQGQFVASRGGAFDPNALLAHSLDPDPATDGAYKVLGIAHTGDTRGDDWYTTATCISTAPTGTGYLVADRFGTAGLY